LKQLKLTSSQIENWVSRHFEYKRRSRGKQLCVCNPFDEDNDYHLWISTVEDTLKNGPRKGQMGYWVHDFRPGHYSGSLINFVMQYKNISFRDALKDLGGTKQLNVHEVVIGLHEVKEQDEEANPIVELPKLSKPFVDRDKSLARNIALNYLKSRRVSEELAIKLNLHYTPSSIVFPYYEYEILVYWQERNILSKLFNFPDEAKTGLLKTDYLYGFDNVIVPNHQVIIVESIFNAISMGEDTVATGGAIIAGRQVQKLEYLEPSILILAPDNDEAGYHSLQKNYYLLKDYFNLAYCVPPQGIKDWNQLDQERGVGMSRAYLSEHTYELTINRVMGFSRLLRSL
jgi:DNA primase